MKKFIILIFIIFPFSSEAKLNIKCLDSLSYGKVLQNELSSQEISDIVQAYEDGSSVMVFKIFDDIINIEFDDGTTISNSDLLQLAGEDSD